MTSLSDIIVRKDDSIEVTSKWNQHEKPNVFMKWEGEGRDAMRGRFVTSGKKRERSLEERGKKMMSVKQVS